MSVWLRRGERSYRWDGYALFGRPPVVVPPAWALTERVWEAIGERPRLSEAEVDPADWLDEVVGSVPDGIERLCLVIPDGTRVGAWQSLLPALLRALGRTGASSRLLLVASGTHAVLDPAALDAHLRPEPSERQEIRKSLNLAEHREHPGGPENPLEGWEVIQNGDKGFDGHVSVGGTPRGTPVRLHPGYLASDYKILLGEVSYHYFAGFGGGPKLVFPGLADVVGAATNHQLAFRIDGANDTGGSGSGGTGSSASGSGGAGTGPSGSVGSGPSGSGDDISGTVGSGSSGSELSGSGVGSSGTAGSGASESSPGEVRLETLRWHLGCAPASLSGNPVHEDLLEAVSLAPPDWVITAAESPPPDPDPAFPRPFPTTVLQGPYPLAFDRAVELREAIGRVALTKAPDLLLADAGGRPRDATFLQAHKSLQHAARFVAPGGRILLAAGCEEGMGSRTLERYAANPGGFRPFAGTDDDPRAVLHLQTLIAMRHAVSQTRVGLWSELPAGIVRALGMEPLSSENEAREWCASAGGDIHWGWLPRAERFLPAPGWLGGR